MTEQLFQRYPELQQIDPVGKALLEKARYLEAPAGTILFRQGDQCENFIFVTSGDIKVLGRNQNGREIVLYRIQNRGTCVLTTSCLLGQQNYPAEGIAESDISAFLLPQQAFEKALSESPFLRQFIFASYSQPLSDMITLVQNVAFESIEHRLANYLIELAGADLSIHQSHQQIADELGTAREVVSRQLKRMEQQSLLTLSRGCIQINDLEKLLNVT